MPSLHSAAVPAAALPVRQEIADQSAGEARALRWGALITLLLALFGFVARLQMLIDGLARPQSNNIFYRLYALYEKPFLVLVAVAAVALMGAITLRPTEATAGRRSERLMAPAGWGVI